MRKAIAILLAVCFVLSLTASAVSAHQSNFGWANKNNAQFINSEATAVTLTSTTTGFNGNFNEGLGLIAGSGNGITAVYSNSEAISNAIGFQS